MPAHIRPSAIAGTWYSGHASMLKQDLDRYLGNLPLQTYENLVGLFVPHAGMRYSGGVAGQAFRHLRGRQYDTVVIISPSHYPYPQALLTSGYHAYETPLGAVPIAQDLLETLQTYIDLTPILNDKEHAIEIELPFLQHLLGTFRLLPIMMLDQSYDMAQALAEALLKTLAGQSVLWVASSDLSHFYPQTIAQTLDEVILQAVREYQPAAVIQAEADGRGFACGRGAIAAVMLAARASHATIEAYATSGDITGDTSRVVGYGSATFYN